MSLHILAVSKGRTDLLPEADAIERDVSALEADVELSLRLWGLGVFQDLRTYQIRQAALRRRVEHFAKKCSN